MAPGWRGRPLEGVLFDLDGTLLDTAADIATALNRALKEHGWHPIPPDEVRRMVGRGSSMLVERAISAQSGRHRGAANETAGESVDEAAGEAAQAAKAAEESTQAASRVCERLAQATADEAAEKSTMAAVLESFFRHYGHLEESGEFEARPYPGAETCLRVLRSAGLRIAVVTNKHERFARGLLERLRLCPFIDCLVGGDSCAWRKPDPGSLLFACQRLEVSASRVLMVGDSTNDVQAARAAGIPVICVPYGYNEGQDPRTLPCDAFVETLADLPGLIGLGSRRAAVHESDGRA